MTRRVVPPFDPEEPLVEQEERRVEVVPRHGYSVRESAASISVPEGTVREAIRLGELVVVNLGHGRIRRRIVILPDDLQAWLRSRRGRRPGEVEP